jgi:hypothetical protein
MWSGYRNFFRYHYGIAYRYNFVLGFSMVFHCIEPNSDINRNQCIHWWCLFLITRWIVNQFFGTNHTKYKYCGELYRNVYHTGLRWMCFGSGINFGFCHCFAHGFMDGAFGTMSKFILDKPEYLIIRNFHYGRNLVWNGREWKHV